MGRLIVDDDWIGEVFALALTLCAAVGGRQPVM